MDRDEILERSRRENLGEDEYEREVSLRSAQLGMKVGLLAWAAGSINKYRRLRQPRELGFAIGSIAAGVLFAVRFACELMGV